MNEEAEAEPSMTLEELSGMRRNSEAVAHYQHEQIEGYVQTLRPLLAPTRVLGKRIGGKREIAGEAKCLARLKEEYAGLFGPPFLLPREFDEDWLSEVGDCIKLYPWEYVHEAKSGSESKQITITSPVRWVINFRSNYTLSQFKDAISGRGQRRAEYVRQFVMNTLVFNLVVVRNKGIVKLFEGLRYTLKSERLPGLGELPVQTLTSCLASFRPADDLMVAATGFSGVPAFIELIDMEALRSLPDPVKTAVEHITGG